MTIKKIVILSLIQPHKKANNAPIFFKSSGLKLLNFQVSLIKVWESAYAYDFSQPSANKKNEMPATYIHEQTTQNWANQSKDQSQ